MWLRTRNGLVNLSLARAVTAGENSAGGWTVRAVFGRLVGGEAGELGFRTEADTIDVAECESVLEANGLLERIGVLLLTDGKRLHMPFLDDPADGVDIADELHRRD